MGVCWAFGVYEMEGILFGIFLVNFRCLDVLEKYRYLRSCSCIVWDLFR
jgi:hypothetical protein